MKEKIWMRMFEYIALVLVGFLLVICIASLFFLDDFFVWREKTLLARSAEGIAMLDLSDESTAAAILRRIEDDNNVQISIYKDNTIIYSTLRTNRPGMTGFDLLFDNGYQLVEEEVENYRSGKFYQATGSKSNKLFVYMLNSGERTVVLSVQQTLISNAARTTGSFTIIVAGVCMVIALISSIVFARKFAHPITEMNLIAKDMCSLDFSKRVNVDSDDEIGQLGRSINELSGALDSALTELSEKNKHLQNEIDAERRMDSVRKGFVASVSHELKTPISIIRGYTELLEAAPDSRRADYCECILSETDRMHKLVINLLELSKIESGMKAECSRFDLTTLSANVIDSMGRMLEDKHISLEYELPDRLEVFSDEMYLRQTLQNFLSNAISHTPDGGTVRIYTEPYGDSIRLCVYNSGSCVDEDEMENVWQSFYRGDKSRNRDSGRYGLGLSIVRACMQSLHCDYGVFNCVDGVCFWVEVKLTDAENPAKN